MRVVKHKASTAKKILIAMIVDSAVLAQIAIHWQSPGLFDVKWANLIGGWCVKFWNKFERPPGRTVLGLFEQWTESKAGQRDENTIELVEKFLAVISDEYEQCKEDIDPSHMIEIAAEYFNTVKAKQLNEKLTESLEDHATTEEIEALIVGHKRVQLGGSSGINALEISHMREVFERAEGDSRVVKYPGALGEFFGRALERDAFVSFMAPEKTGKTALLLDLAYRAISQRKRVAFFQVGDLSQNQVLRRLACRVAHRPFYPTTDNRPLKVPIKIKRVDGKVKVTYELQTFDEMLTLSDTRDAIRDLISNRIKSKADYLRLVCQPAGTMTVAAIQATLDEWSRAGDWTPEVVAIDYSDILAPPPGIRDLRDQINANWEQMRALSQRWHCLVATATQSDANSYEADLLRRQNFSNDKRKLAHVTGMCGINSTTHDRKAGYWRLNWINLRESEYSEARCVYLATCLAISNPAVKSCW